MSRKRSVVFYSSYPIRRNSVIDGKFTAGEESYIILKGRRLAEKYLCRKGF